MLFSCKFKPKIINFVYSFTFSLAVVAGYKVPGEKGGCPVVLVWVKKRKEKNRSRIRGKRSEREGKKNNQPSVRPKCTVVCR
jgi:hypothetical protein